MTLNVAAVESFTRGRLDSDDAETVSQLAAALAAARGYCGWHVTPVLTAQTVILDGPGAELLVLPTLKLTQLTSVSEDGVALTLGDLNWSARGLIRKRDGYYWTSMFGAVSVVFSHGYADAADFESAVLSSIERGAFSQEKTPRSIGPFQYSASLEDRSPFLDAERAVLDRYRLEKTT